MKRTLLVVAMSASMSAISHASLPLSYEDMYALNQASPQLVSQESSLRTLASAYGIPVANPYDVEEEVADAPADDSVKEKSK